MRVMVSCVVHRIQGGARGHALGDALEAAIRYRYRVGAGFARETGARVNTRWAIREILGYSRHAGTMAGKSIEAHRHLRQLVQDTTGAQKFVTHWRSHSSRSGCWRRGVLVGCR